MSLKLVNYFMLQKSLDVNDVCACLKENYHKGWIGIF
jgi:hypothetical protein